MSNNLHAEQSYIVNRRDCVQNTLLFEVKISENVVGIKTLGLKRTHF